MAEALLIWLYVKQNLIYLLIIIGLILFALFLPRKQKRIILWEKSLNLPKHARTFEQLYQDVNGHLLSLKARQDKDAIDFVYGEIEFRSFIALMSLAQPDSNTVFYDLGSGTGKAVLACAMVYPVSKCVGVELFPLLHASACAQAQKLAQIPEYAQRAQQIEFIQENFLETDISDATIIFINSTMLIGETWELLCLRLKNLPKLKTVITTSKPLINNGFSLISSTKIEVSWGIIFAYIQTKKQIYTNWLENIE